MLSNPIQKYISTKKLIIPLFFGVLIVLLPIIFFVTKGLGFVTNQSLNIVLYSLAISILIVWSLILLAKSNRYKSTISEQGIKLQKEIETRVQAIQELQATHKKLSSTSGYLERIIHESTDLITAIDNEYRYISFNNSFKESMKGYFNVDVEVGVKLDNILRDFPKKLETAKKHWTRALAGESYSTEQFFTDITGEINIYELRYSPIKNKTGEIIGASQIARNVTEKNLAAEKIKRERDFASTIFDVNKSMILVLDRDGRIVRFNQACETVSGYTEEEVEGRIIWNVLIPTGNISEVKQRHRNCDWGEYKQEYVNPWVTKDENIRTISWQISTIKDENGTNDYIVASGIDITEKQKSEIEQKRMLEIFENSTDLISISDLNGQIIYLNKAGKEMLGIDDETQTAPIKTNKCHPQWVNDKLKKEIYPEVIKNGTWLGQTALKTLDGDEIPTSQLVMVHHNQQDEPEYFSSVIRDVSLQNKITQELEVAKETASKNTHISSAFLANMSHEIRTPMNGVIGLADLLLNTKLNDEQRDYVETIQRSGDSLLKIINDILDFSKLETGTLRFENIEFDLHETIESVFELFTPKLIQKKLELGLNIHRNVPSALRGDPDRLRQVLINFIGNAIKFTEQGEIIITVKVLENGSSPTIHFSIKDSGIGVSAGALRKLFNPFIQADSSITKRFGGTGLGLAISKQYITKMNGDLGASSEEKVGSTFWFTAIFEAQPIEKQRSFSDPALENVKTLIVDNNESIRNILQSLTKSWGLLPDVANSAEEAIKILNSAAKQNENFDVILISLEMTKTDGISLVNKIKSEPKLRATKIILMPAQNNQQAIRLAKDKLIDSFLTKPIKQTKLFDELINLFSNKSDNIEKHNEIENSISLKSPCYSRNILNEKGASTMTTNNTQHQRILIAEDNLVNQKVILNQVSRLGYEVDLVENGKDALDALQLKEYALILMDCQMPVMDGFTATKHIRNEEKDDSKHIPIIAVTAHAIEGDRERCLAVGMDDYISKPTKQQSLAKAISFWLHRSTQDIISGQIRSEPALPTESKKEYTELEHITERLSELSDTCGKETVLECIKLFIQDTDELILSLKHSIAHDDLKRTAIEAHKLKGSSSNMGATRLPKLAQKLISFSRDQKYASLELILKQIAEEYKFIKNIYLDKQNEFEESSQNLLAVG